MRIINVISKAVADKLSAKGFQYSIKKIQGKEVYVFIETDDLVKELCGDYDQASFFMSKYMTF